MRTGIVFVGVVGRGELHYYVEVSEPQMLEFLREVTATEPPPGGVRAIMRSLNGRPVKLAGEEFELTEDFQKQVIERFGVVMSKTEAMKKASERAAEFKLQAEAEGQGLILEKGERETVN